MTFSISPSAWTPKTSAFKPYQKEVAVTHTFVKYSDTCINHEDVLKMVWESFLKSNPQLNAVIAQPFPTENLEPDLNPENACKGDGKVLVYSTYDKTTGKKPVIVFETKGKFALPTLYKKDPNANEVAASIAHEIALDSGILAMSEEITHLLEKARQLPFHRVPFAKGRILNYTVKPFDITIVRQGIMYRLYPDVPSLSITDIMYGFQRLVSAFSCLHSNHWIIPGFSIHHISYQHQGAPRNFQITDLGRIQRPGPYNVLERDFTIHYSQLAPETFFTGHYVDKSDIYGLGIALLEAYLPEYFKELRFSEDGIDIGSKAEKYAYLQFYVEQFGPLHEEFITSLPPDWQDFCRRISSTPTEGAVWEELRSIVEQENDNNEFAEFLIIAIKEMLCASPKYRPTSLALLTAVSSKLSAYNESRRLDERYKDRTKLTVTFKANIPGEVKISFVPLELFHSRAFNPAALKEFFGATLTNITGGFEYEFGILLPESKLSVFSLEVNGKPSEGASLMRIFRTPKGRENRLVLNV